MNLHLYLLKPSMKPTGEAHWDKAIVLAGSSEEARKIHPRGFAQGAAEWTQETWTKAPHLVEVTYLGECLNGNLDKPQVLVASFTNNQTPLKAVQQAGLRSSVKALSKRVRDMTKEITQLREEASQRRYHED